MLLGQIGLFLWHVLWCAYYATGWGTPQRGEVRIMRACMMACVRGVCVKTVLQSM